MNVDLLALVKIYKFILNLFYTEFSMLQISSFVPSVTRSMVLLVLLLALSYEFSTLLSGRLHCSLPALSFLLQQ